MHACLLQCGNRSHCSGQPPKDKPLWSWRSILGLLSLSLGIIAFPICNHLSWHKALGIHCLLEQWESKLIFGKGFCLIGSTTSCSVWDLLSPSSCLSEQAHPLRDPFTPRQTEQWGLSLLVCSGTATPMRIRVRVSTVATSHPPCAG